VIAVDAPVGAAGALQLAWLKGPVTRVQRYEAPPGVQFAVSVVSCAVVGLVTPEIEQESFAQVSVKLPPDRDLEAGAVRIVVGERGRRRGQGRCTEGTPQR
jgi:hypothetical protein